MRWVGGCNRHWRSIFAIIAFSIVGFSVEANCAAAAAPADWPVDIGTPQGGVEIYQPQPEKMQGNLLTARAAVSITPAASTTSPPARSFGSMWFTAVVTADRDTRMVSLSQIKVKHVVFRGSKPAEEQAFGQTLTTQLQKAELTFPLDELTATLDTAKQEKAKELQLATTPPRIIFSTTPATLISVHGSPVLKPVEGHAGVSRVVNTPFILLFDQGGKKYFLKAGSRWVTADDLRGPWTDTSTVPAEVSAAGTGLATPADPQSPQSKQLADLSPAVADARVIVATDPSELIVTNGDPKFTPVPGGAGGELLYASNTVSDLFMDQTDRRYYVVLSGRWYAATSMQGPWQYVASDKLPAAFAQIPEDSPKADVLPFVAKTAQAHEAVLDAGIPQTSTIRRDAGGSLTVAYDGDPKFADVPKCKGVAYALNTPEQVLRVDGVYYCCHQAVWYQSPAPTGPWAVCLSVPKVIYTLPPSCPDYNTSFVYVYDSSPDSVTTGYLPGYTGSYVYGPTVVYGTGYDYPGWDGDTYFPPPCTFGFDSYYDPYACDWGFDADLYYGGFGWFAHPYHDAWWRDHPNEQWAAHQWWGPSGFVRSADLRAHLAQARDANAFPGKSTAALAARLPGEDRGGPGWHNLYVRAGNLARNARVNPSQARTQTPSHSEAPQRTQAARADIYAGSEGTVYRRTDAGWEQIIGGQWSKMNSVPEAQPTYHPAPAATNAPRSYAAPEAGLYQHAAAREQGSFRSTAVGGFSGGGGARGGGGGSHGGGGGRR